MPRSWPVLVAFLLCGCPDSTPPPTAAKPASPADPPPKPIPKQRLEAAKRVYDNGELENALAVTQRLLTSTPDDPEALLLLVAIHRDLEQDEEAVLAAQRAIAIQPDDVETRYALANALYGVDAQRAHSAYSAVLELDPKHRGALVSRGLCSAQLDDTDAYLADLEAAIAIPPKDPRNTYAHELRAELHVQRGAFALAAEDFCFLTTKSPRHLTPAVWLTAVSGDPAPLTDDLGSGGSGADLAARFFKGELDYAAARKEAEVRPMFVNMGAGRDEAEDDHLADTRAAFHALVGVWLEAKGDLSAALKEYAVAAKVGREFSSDTQLSRARLKALQ